VPPYQIVLLILYKLKSGCQWRMLPVRQFFSDDSLTWQGVYYHFNRWSKLDCWKKAWIHLLTRHHSHLDLSSAQLDGSHTPVKNGGQAVGYQDRKAAKTTNSLFLCDNQGTMLSFATPQKGNHHDLYEIQPLFEELTELLGKADIDLRGLFLNADPGFDGQTFRNVCAKKEMQVNIKPNPRNTKKDEYQYFDDQLYKRRVVVERANAWVDSFKTLLVRFETLVVTWCAFHLLAFIILFLRKINKPLKG